MIKDGHVIDSSLFRDRLSQLAAYAPRLREPDTSFGQWRGGQAAATADNCISMPWFEPSHLAQELSDVLDRTNWVLEEGSSAQQDGQDVVVDPDAIRRADAEQLAKLLTALVRGERFAEGTLAMAFGNGLAVAERAEMLFREP